MKVFTSLGLLVALQLGIVFTTKISASDVGFLPNTSGRFKRAAEDFHSILKQKTKSPKWTYTSRKIMLSYASQEGRGHAKKLKAALVKRGYSVWLDVDEIKIGSDWQTALNVAVQECTFFVPLVTPLYGETAWTKREYMQANIMNKHILPINFMAVWPPESLAIQMATLQFIPWHVNWKAPAKVTC